MARPSIAEEEIDALINANGTVPRNACLLENELAELKMRMSQGGGESPPQNKMFDLFLGPEVYDWNVDPATVVNWPGARGGEKTDVQLAADLGTALKQAMFASAVLSQMKEEANEGGVRYFVGERELFPERVAFLRSCVDEAKKAGIVEDWEVIAVKRSRLQMLVVELLPQPMERLQEIAGNYKDLIMSKTLADLVRERLHAMARRDLDA